MADTAFPTRYRADLAREKNTLGRKIAEARRARKLTQAELSALLKDYGIPLLGIQSGGGSCCVLYNPSPEGFGYRYSTHRARLNNLKGENIDEGIKPDYELDVNDFFDIAKVGQLIEQFYAK